MKRTRTPTATSDLSKDFFALPGEDRNARLVGLPEFPQPIQARLDRNGYLTWIWYKSERDGGKRSPKLQRPRNGLCFEFAQLADNEDFRRFAGKWGPLGIDSRQEEHIDQWRRYAALAQALLRFAGSRATGASSSEEDWRTICAFLPVDALERRHFSLRQQLAIAALALNTWFAAAQGHRILDVVEGQFQVRPGASNLLGVLAVQLAHAITRSDQLAQCAGCKISFTPKRRISHGTRQYCSRCRRAKLPQRDAARDWRTRKR
jgi:hypothetical protein